MKRTTSVIYQICYNIYIPVCIKIKLHIFHNYSGKFCNLHQSISKVVICNETDHDSKTFARNLVFERENPEIQNQSE